ncbi:MAG: TetR/AcrR family transcriptional regulator [Allobaculum sp.]|nr:TetR/AcrR family transcriptional regulator [Allobaculum sp.]
MVYFEKKRVEQLMEQKTVQDKIFETSQKLFRQKGFDAVTIDEICVAVGISKPTFYAKKLTKRTLLLQAYQVKESPFFSVNEKDVLRAIAALIDQVVQAMLRHGPELFGDFLKEHLKKPAFDTLFVSNWTTRFVQLIEKGQREGVILNQDDPHTLVKIIQAYLLGYGFQYALGSTNDIEKHLHRSIATILLANPNRMLNFTPSALDFQDNPPFSLKETQSSFSKRNKS